MRPTQFSSIALALLTVLGAGTAFAQDAAPMGRGPQSFEALDADGDGRVSADEFARARNERIRERAEQQRPMRHLSDAPAFADIDADSNGVLSREEIDAHHQQRIESRAQERMQWRSEGAGPAGGPTR